MALLLPALWLGRKHWTTPQDVSSGQGTDRALILITAIVALVATLLSSHLAASVVCYASWIWIVAAALLVRQLAASASLIRLVLAGIAIGAAVGCLAVWLQWTEGTPMTAVPHYQHIRLFGLHMMAGTVAALAWIGLTAPRSSERMLAYPTGVISCGGMLWSGGRTPLVGVAAGLAIWFWSAPKSERSILIRSVLIVFLGGALLSLLRWSPDPALGWWGAFARTTAATSVDKLSSTRLSFWSVTWHEILQSPWFGHGADSYRFILPKQDGNQPHNWILQFLCDFGVLGFIPLALLLLRQAYRGLAGHGSDGETEVVRARRAAAGALTACLAAGLLDGVFYHVVILLPAALFAGMAGATSTGISICKSRWPAITAGTLAVISAVVLGLHGYLFAALLQPSAPSGPDAPAPRLLRVFPSTTVVVERWLNAWRRTHPEAVLEWTHWAQAHSDNPAPLHVYAALLYSERGDLASAAREVDEAMLKEHHRSLYKLRRLQEAIRAAQEHSVSAPPTP
jgi:O-antigen ligase